MSAETRTCRVCDEAKLWTSYNWYPRGDNPTVLHQSRCRDCTNAARRARYRERRAREIAAKPPKPPVTERRCNRCGETKPLDHKHFAPWKRGKSGDILAWHYWCKPCNAAYSRERKARDRDAENAKSRDQYHRRMQDPDVRIEQREKDRLRKRRWLATGENRKRAAEQRRRWQRKAMKNPSKAAQRRESARLAYRLRRERNDGVSVDDIRLVRPALPIPTSDAPNLVPARPLAVAILKVVAREGDDSGTREAVCGAAGIDPRQLHAWETGGIQEVQVGTADRVLLGLGLLWWEVWTDEGADVAEQAWAAA